MKIVFFGTPEYVLPILDALNKSFKIKGNSPIVAVVTQKPKPVGRKKILTYSAVDRWAHSKNIPIFFDAIKLKENGIKADIGILAAYGKILTDEVINYFPKGILNIHFSKLPEFRGASPVHATIIDKKEAFVTIIKIDNQLDHGPIIAQFKEEVRQDDTTNSLRKRLFVKAAQELNTLILPYSKGKISPRAQEHSKATYTTTITKAHGYIPSKYINSLINGNKLNDRWKIDFIKDYYLTPTPEAIERFTRAMNPWPIAWTTIVIDPKKKKRKNRLKIFKARSENQKLILEQVQLEGKNKVAWSQFIQGYPNTIFE